MKLDMGFISTLVRVFQFFPWRNSDNTARSLKPVPSNQRTSGVTAGNKADMTLWVDLPIFITVRLCAAR